jgi:hypothetical protein
VAVKHPRAPFWIHHRRLRIEQLGFDPDQLTPEEQKELIDLQEALRLASGAPLPTPKPARGGESVALPDPFD